LGLEPEVLGWLSEKLRPEALAYLSCSAGTLARDLSVLQNSGYSVRRIIPYDFFPQTPHVEALALVERVS
jgi:tRNA/tmRNA/rRNA uracil-C5-methylase (TrmA/RlmC/RlmD family)